MYIETVCVCDWNPAFLSTTNHPAYKTNRHITEHVWGFLQNFTCVNKHLASVGVIPFFLNAQYQSKTGRISTVVKQVAWHKHSRCYWAVFKEAWGRSHMTRCYEEEEPSGVAFP